MTDQEKQNTYGDPLYCIKCHRLLEKARTNNKKGVCLKCQRINRIEYWKKRSRIIKK